MDFTILVLSAFLLFMVIACSFLLYAYFSLRENYDALSAQCRYCVYRNPKRDFYD